MSAKEKQKVSKIVFLICLFSLLLVLIYVRFTSGEESYAKENEGYKQEDLKISNAKEINLEEIIQKNTKQTSNKEELYERQEELE